MSLRESFKGREYTIDTVKVGESASFKIQITEEMQEAFFKLSGDDNPVHTDSAYAVAQGYADVLVYGFLTAAGGLSRLCGVYLPGLNCLLQECSIQWSNPVYIGDELTVYGKVKEVDRRFQRITIRADIKNQNNEKVCRATIICGLRSDRKDEE